MYCFRPKPLPRRADVCLALALLLTTAACSRSRTYSTSSGDVTVDQKGKNARNLMLESPDDAPKIVGFYQKGLDTNAWKIASSVTTGQTTLFHATKERRELMVQIGDHTGKRSIMQIVTDKP